LLKQFEGNTALQNDLSLVVYR